MIGVAGVVRLARAREGLVPKWAGCGGEGQLVVDWAFPQYWTLPPPGLMEEQLVPKVQHRTLAENRLMEVYDAIAAGTTYTE